jgi:hypothetical protein
VKIPRLFGSPSTNPRPVIGDTIMVNGVRARIIAVYSGGTVDAQLPNGKLYRVSGLPFR